MKKYLFLSIVCFLSLNLLAQNNDQPVAQELVGKWCFTNLNGSTADVITNSCVVLNADGSYEASLNRNDIPAGVSVPILKDSDYGKWWAKGNRLFFESSTDDEAKGSFVFQKVNHPRLENTPMIVVYGVAFAAASPREKW